MWVVAQKPGLQMITTANHYAERDIYNMDENICSPFKSLAPLPPNFTVNRDDYLMTSVPLTGDRPIGSQVETHRGKRVHLASIRDLQ